MDTLTELIKSGNLTDSQIIRLLDSVPSDLLHIVFEDKSERIQKFRSIYSNILKVKQFRYTSDVVEEIGLYEVTMTDKLFQFIKKVSDYKDKVIDFDQLIEIFENYMLSNNLGSSYDKAIYSLFKNQLDMLNWKSLNKFRIGLLISTEVL